MGLLDGAKEWVLKIALKKALKRAAPWVLGFALMFVKKANDALDPAGVSINVNDAELAAAISVGFGLLQNFVKTKFNIEWL